MWPSIEEHRLSCNASSDQFYRSPVLATSVWNVKHFLYYGRVDKEDEMTCLIKGCNFVLKNIPHEAFVYAKHSDSEFRFQTTQPDIFPYLLVNIGSGVSIVKVITSVLIFFLFSCKSVYIWKYAVYFTFISWLTTFYSWGNKRRFSNPNWLYYKHKKYLVWRNCLNAHTLQFGQTERPHT